jgi:hypothetical protein
VNRPNFTDAVTQFQHFLSQNNYCDTIAWVMPADVLLTGKRYLYVRVPIPQGNERRACKLYDEGMAKGRGVLMSTICRMNRSTYCHVWFPKSDADVPAGIWPSDGGLKFSAISKSLQLAGRPVRDRGLWTLLNLWHWKNQELKNYLFS